MSTYTEEEARRKWCHRTSCREPESLTRCIASGCMAWRKNGQIGIGPNGEKRDRDMDGRTRWVDTGYCGLAGKP